MTETRFEAYRTILQDTERQLFAQLLELTREPRWPPVASVLTAIEWLRVARRALRPWESEPVELPPPVVEPAAPPRLEPVSLPPPDPSGLLEPPKLVAAAVPHRPSADILEAAVAAWIERMAVAVEADDETEVAAVLPALGALDRARRVVSGQAVTGRGGERLDPPSPMPPDSGG